MIFVAIRYGRIKVVARCDTFLAAVVTDMIVINNINPAFRHAFFAAFITGVIAIIIIILAIRDIFFATIIAVVIAVMILIVAMNYAFFADVTDDVIVIIHAGFAASCGNGEDRQADDQQEGQ